MPWIPDVYTNLTIYSTQWGNLIRDRVHHVFATVAEMKATAVPIVGMVAYCVDTKTEYRWDGTGWLILNEPWQAHPGVRIIAGNAVWRLGASGAGVGNLRLSPQSQSRFRRSFLTIDVECNVVFQDGYPVGQPSATLVMELPVNVDNGSMTNILGGSAFAFMNSLGGQYRSGGASAQGNNVWSMAGPAASNGAGSDWPIPADSWGVNLHYPTTAQYA